MQTREKFYALRNGGGYRTARTVIKCEQSLCLHRVQPGEEYLDTKEVTEWPRTKRICKPCAETTT